MAANSSTSSATLGVIIGNRDFFPDVLVGEARKDIVNLFEQLAIKPIMLTPEGQVKVLDFGVAKLTERPGSGAAGGLGAALAALGAELVPGAAYVLEAVGFRERAAAADLVVTGEGTVDRTTFGGKAPGEGGSVLLRMPAELKDKLREPADLKGRTVAVVSRGAILVYELIKVLEAGGLTLADINLKYIPFGQMATDMEAGTVSQPLIQIRASAHTLPALAVFLQHLPL